MLSASLFLALSFEKIKTGVFDGQQIHAVVHDQNFVIKMNNKEMRTWFSFVAVMENFLCNETLVTILFSAFHHLGCNVSVKLHFLYSHLDRFPENFGAISDERGKQFHQDLKRNTIKGDETNI